MKMMALAAGETAVQFDSGTVVLAKAEIMSLIPHRGEAFVLDGIRIGNNGKRVGVFTPTADYFEGHFPGYPILPGHWLLESMALFALIESMLQNRLRNVEVRLRGNDHFRVLRPVHPGDTIEVTTISSVPLNFQDGVYSVEGTFRASVAGLCVARATILGALTPRGR